MHCVKRHCVRNFRPNRKFRRDYDQIFNTDPIAANLFLLLAELADEYGEITATDEELAHAMKVRFDDPTEYALGGDSCG